MIQDVAASVHQRLLNRAKAEGRPFNELLQYFAPELDYARRSRRYRLPPTEPKIEQKRELLSELPKRACDRSAA